MLAEMKEQTSVLISSGMFAYEKFIKLLNSSLFEQKKGRHLFGHCRGVPISLICFRSDHGWIKEGKIVLRKNLNSAKIT